MHAEHPNARGVRARALVAWADVVRRVRSEFSEMPCMRLTQEQARRLFGLEPFACSLVLSRLVDDHFLRCADGFYSKN